MSYLVKFKPLWTGQQPHYVRESKAGGYLCDDHCLGYKSSNICSHTLAVALKKGTVSNFIRWYETLKVKPNFTTLSKSCKPSTSGQKPKRKGAPKKVTMQVQKMLANTSEDSFVSRVATKRQSLCSGVLNPATSDAATLVQTTGFLSPLVASSGNHSPVVVSQFCHGPPPLTHVSDDSLATTSRGVQTPETYLGPSSLQPSFQMATAWTLWQSLPWSLLPCGIPIDVLLLTYCSNDGMDMFTYESPFPFPFPRFCVFQLPYCSGPRQSGRLLFSPSSTQT